MSMFRCVLAIACVLSTEAMADGGTKPAPDLWTGFYIGANVGGALGPTNAAEVGLPSTTLANGNYRLDHQSDGILAGATLGYNLLCKDFLLGIEADAVGTSVDGTGRIDGSSVTLRSGLGGDPANYVSAQERIDYLGTLRVRVGILAAPELLIFATGGAAYAKLEYSGDFHFPAITYSASDEQGKFGWTAGGGAEYAVGQRWSLKTEYLYYDLGDHSVTSNYGTEVSNPPYQSRFDFNTHGSIVRAGLNYNLGN